MLGQNKIIGFISSKDLKKARAFYEQVLDLKFVKDDGFALVFTAGDRMVRIADVRKVPDFKPQPFTILGWEVANVRATASSLHERGVTFERYPYLEQDTLGVWSSPNGDAVAWFKDPDGNLLSISQHT